MSQSYACVMRWWREDEADETPDWRFTLTLPTDSQQQYFFTDIDGLLTAVRQHFEVDDQNYVNKQSLTINME